jgi:hypothetical protein
VTDAPEWLVPGAPVVVYNRGGTSTPGNPTKTKVNKVATKSFTVEGSTERFQIRRSRVVAPLDSDEARHELSEARKRKLARLAQHACEQWMRSPGEGNRIAAIEALQAVED